MNTTLIPFTAKLRILNTRTLISFIVGLLFCLSPDVSSAQQSLKPSSLQEQLTVLQKAVEHLTQTVEQQQKVIEALQSSKGSTLAASDTASPAPTNMTTPRPSGTYVPDIGVVADIVGTSSQSREDDDGNDRLSVRELELVFGHDIDPYSRMDVVATLSDLENPDIEEANVTYWGLPLGIKGKIGRMRERVGKASSTHRDALETVDEPLVVQRYLGNEGLFRTGIELSAFTPLSLDTFTQELIVGVMEGGVGEGGQLFGEIRRYPSLYSHLANFLEISDITSFELGGTYLAGSGESGGNFGVDAIGIDATLAHFFSPQHKLKLQSELYLQHRDETTIVEEPGLVRTFNGEPLGLYALADYRLAERWGVGTRFDYVEPTELEMNSRSAEHAYSGYLTFFQSEFARWRLQYQHTLQLDNSDDNRFMLQGTFAIGAHKHNLN